MSFPEQMSNFAPSEQPPDHPPTPPARAARRRRPLVWILAVLGALVLLGGAAGVYFVAFAPITVNGSVTVANAGQGFTTTECRGTGAFSDLAGGTAVVISDASGKTIALGQLQPGHVSGTNCVFQFSVEAPRSDFYGIEVSHRGVVKYSLAEVQAGRVSIGIG